MQILLAPLSKSLWSSVIDPSFAIFLKSRRFEDIKYDTERCLGHQLGHVWSIIWGMSGASSGACLGQHLGHIVNNGQQWTTIRGATCLSDAVFL